MCFGTRALATMGNCAAFDVYLSQQVRTQLTVYDPSAENGRGTNIPDGEAIVTAETLKNGSSIESVAFYSEINRRTRFSFTPKNELQSHPLTAIQIAQRGFTVSQLKREFDTSALTAHPATRREVSRVPRETKFYHSRRMHCVFRPKRCAVILVIIAAITASGILLAKVKS